ncbi:hypothetical protein EMIT0357P_50044 [Pseudomonas marginalis]
MQNPGVHQFPQGLHTFQNAFCKDTSCVVANAHGVPELQKEIIAADLGGNPARPQGPDVQGYRAGHRSLNAKPRIFS